MSKLYGLSSPSNGAIPVFYWYKSDNNDNFITTKNSEGLELNERGDYIEKGVWFYIFPSEQKDSQTVPVFRWVDPTSNRHLYTVGGSDM